MQRNANGEGVYQNSAGQSQAALVWQVRLMSQAPLTAGTGLLPRLRGAAYAERAAGQLTGARLSCWLPVLGGRCLLWHRCRGVEAGGPQSIVRGGPDAYMLHAEGGWEGRGGVWGARPGASHSQVKRQIEGRVKRRLHRGACTGGGARCVPAGGWVGSQAHKLLDGLAVNEHCGRVGGAELGHWACCPGCRWRATVVSRRNNQLPLRCAAMPTQSSHSIPTNHYHKH